MCWGVSSLKYLGHFTPSVSPNHNISTDLAIMRVNTSQKPRRLNGLAQINKVPEGGGAWWRPDTWELNSDKWTASPEKTNRWRAPQQRIISGGCGQSCRLMSLSAPPIWSGDGGKMICWKRLWIVGNSINTLCGSFEHRAEVNFRTRGSGSFCSVFGSEHHRKREKVYRLRACSHDNPVALMQQKSGCALISTHRSVA